MHPNSLQSRQMLDRLEAFKMKHDGTYIHTRVFCVTSCLLQRRAYGTG